MVAQETQSAQTDRRREAVACGLVAVAVLAYYLSPNLLLTAVASLALLCVVWARLDMGLLAVLLTAPFYRFPKTLDLSAVTALVGRSAALEISLAEYLLGVCVLAWLLGRLWSPRFYWVFPPETSPLREPRVWLLPVLLIAAALVSLPFTENKHVALREFRIIVLEPALFYLLLMDTLRRTEDISRYLWAFVGLGLAIGLYSLYQYVFIGTVESTGGVGRALAVYHSPNALALFFGRVIPVAAALGLAAWMARSLSPNSHRRWQIAFVGVSLLAMAAAFYITYSRGAVLGVGAAGLVLLFGLSRRSALLVLAACVVAGVVALGVLPQDRLLAAAPLVQRLYVWQAALNMAVDHPLTGVGMDNFLYYYPRYILPQAALEPNISHAHNLLLDFWTRLGILGLVTLAALQGYFWWQFKGLLGRPLTLLQRWLALGLAASMADFLVHGLIDNSYFLIDLAFIFWMTYALMTILARATLAAPATEGNAPA